MSGPALQDSTEDRFSLRDGWPARKAALAAQHGSIVDRCTGNGLEEFNVRAEFDITTMELMDLLLDYNVERCPGCRWLVDSHELIGEDSDDVDGHCRNCRPRT
jgi:hypothetical protein